MSPLLLLFVTLASAAPNQEPLPFEKVIHMKEIPKTYTMEDYWQTLLRLIDLITAFSSAAPHSVDPDTEWQEYMESTNVTVWRDWRKEDYLLGDDFEAEIIDAVSCSDGYMLEGEDCVRDPTSCSKGKIFNGQECVCDPLSPPIGYIVEDGKCERDPSFPPHFFEEDIEECMLCGLYKQCRCRSGYHFSNRRGFCIKCRRRSAGGYRRCGC